MSPATTSEQEPKIIPRWSARIFAALLGAAFLGILPLLIKGNVATHDLPFHISSWNEVAQQWRHGVVWPRWAAMANYGLGEPRFIFYPPTSWLLGGLLALWLPLRALPGAFSFIAFVAAGAGMFTLARRYLPHGFAISAAMLYALNPYHLITVYGDFRVAEMLASAVFPVAILFALRCAERLRAISGLAIAVAAVWLMNAPAGVMLMYTLTLLLLVLALGKRSIRPLLYGTAAMGLGMGLAAFYLLPASYEQSWVNIFGAFAFGLTPNENFLFSVATMSSHTYFNFLVSGIALEQIALLAFALIFAWKAQRKAQSDSLWLAGITVVGLVAAFMMFRLSSILWSLPKMQFLQLPWRWMLVVDLALCLAGMMALTTARTKWVWAILAVIFLGQIERDMIRQATWGKRPPVELYRSSTNDGYHGTIEYLPRDVHVEPRPYVLPSVPTTELRCEVPCASDAVKVLRWSEENKKMEVHVAVPTSLVLKLYDYPAWQVWVDGAPALHGATYGGQIKLELPPGRHEVDVRFTRTPDRTAGLAVSALSVIVLALFAFFTRPRRRTQSASPARC